MNTAESKSSYIHIEESMIGVFGINDDGKIIEKTLYPNDPNQIAAALNRQQRGEVTKEVKKTIEKVVQRGFNTIIFSNKSLAESVEQKWDVDVKVTAPKKSISNIKDKLDILATEFEIVQTKDQFYSLSHKVSMLMAANAVSKILSDRGVLISHSVQIMRELDKTLNILPSGLREWYSVHFPELNRLIKDHQTYAKVVIQVDNRVDLSPSAISGLGFSNKKIENIQEASKNSIGIPFNKEDLIPIKQLAKQIVCLFYYRGEIEKYLSNLTKNVAPNLAEVAGPILAAKLIEKAGGLRRLSMMPSSTIQILGAEKAMFRALKYKTKLPKHGLIYQHHLVHSSPRWMRGRVARAIASKMAIAARADVYSGKRIAPQLMEDIDSKLKSMERRE